MSNDDHEDDAYDARKRRERDARKTATEFTWSGSLSEYELDDLQDDCRISITAKQLRGLICDAHYEHAE